MPDSCHRCLCSRVLCVRCLPVAVSASLTAASDRPRAPCTPAPRSQSFRSSSALRGTTTSLAGSTVGSSLSAHPLIPADLPADASTGQYCHLQYLLPVLPLTVLTASTATYSTYCQHCHLQYLLPVLPLTVLTQPALPLTVLSQYCHLQYLLPVLPLTVLTASTATYYRQTHRRTTLSSQPLFRLYFCLTRP